MKLEHVQKGARIRGLAAEGIATVKSVEFHGSNALEAIFADAKGALHTRIITRDDEPSLEAVEASRPWSFDADGDTFRLVSEARRIQLAWLFDPYVAITSSTIEPLPHQISAVYEEMLPRQPMRFLLADDPGAGKTIMAGLLIKELMIRGDLERCLIISPGSLTEQWQDELGEKFGLEFDLLTRDMMTAARTSNPFEHKNLLIARLDQLSRNEEIQERLKAAPEWDLVVCDEAHRMSGHVSGDEIKLTGRYQFGQVVGQHTRNLLLMTATPHNGNEADFQIFLGLLDGDRFAGRFREGEHKADPSDLMRRLVKEDLLRFDGSKLFPERRSYTPHYDLSGREANLYADVTEYVRLEMNRAERFADKDAARKVNVGFALMTLQRRLASSPEAIFRSIQRRRERLEARLREERLVLRGKGEATDLAADAGPKLDEDDWDELYDEAPQEEREDVEQKVVDHATAARTVEELAQEIVRLKELESLAKEVNSSGEDAKWQELTTILDHPLMTDEHGARRKLVVFTEFKDTLLYLSRRIRTRLGKPEAVEEIHGAVARDKRKAVVERFMTDPTLLVLVANDAAGEGVNLQRAHLMVNYDLPWNPNRLEQRFGRIHRIGQTEVCHLWNLVAKDTREGEVYHRLLEKLDVERNALGGKVFDVLGQLFDKKPLRELLMEAIRYGSDLARKAELLHQTDNAVERDHILAVFERQALVRNEMDLSRVMALREDMERAHARRLQPHFVQSFFNEAFKRLGGTMHRREEGRFEITHVPTKVRELDRAMGTGAPVQTRYERVTFDKKYVDEQPRAHLVCPGSGLLEATIGCTLDEQADTLKRGAVLVDDGDEGTTPRLMFTLEHVIRDGRKGRHGAYNAVSQRLEFVEVGEDGKFRHAGAAPYLDYRSASDVERQGLVGELNGPWLRQEWEPLVTTFAIEHVVPAHIESVKRHRLPLLAKVEAEVKARLTKEVRFWDARAEELRARERAGKKTKLPAQVAEERANRLGERLKTRMVELHAERTLFPEPPLLKGGALVVPRGLLRKLGVQPAASPSDGDADRELTERIAMEIVVAAERALGREPRDRSAERGLGYDLESRDPDVRHLFFVEVKGRLAGADSVTLTRNEILCALNEPERFRLAIVLVENGVGRAPVYVTQFDFGQPGFAQTSASYALKQLPGSWGATAMSTYRKKLIEVALPLEAINAACVEDKNRKTGHIRNLHKWFAPMPLPAWRAMLAATLLDDPSNDLPEPEAAHQRALLFDLIRDLAPIDAYRNKALMDRARAAIYEACNGDLPYVVDPFCGGGSTIVEAQRLGLPTIASDLNPVPVLITTALCRAPQLFRDLPPVSEARATAVEWRGADGLLADVRHYAGLVRDRAFSKLKGQYLALPDRSVPYAWRWAWSVASPNPAARGAYVPLVSDWLLSKHRGHAVWVKATVDPEKCTMRYSIERDGSPPKGNVGRGGATCLYTGTPIPLDHIRLEGQAHRLKLTLLAAAVQRGEGRDFVAGEDVPLPTSAEHAIEGIPIHPGALGFRVQAYGITDYRDLYTPRQSETLFTFAQAIDEVHADVLRDARRWLVKDETPLEDGGEGVTAYADAVCAVLGLLLGKMAQSNNVLVRWFIDPRNGSGKATPSFERNAVPMVWDFVETNPFGGATGDWAGAVQETALRAFDLVAPDGPASRVFQEDVRRVAERYPSKVVVACDPPYYDNIGYADLSDVFFLWLRPALRRAFPRLFGTLAAPKEAELIASPARRGGPEPARVYFREGFTEAFERLATSASSDFPMSIVYALKQTEGADNGESTATGWDLFLSGLLDAGLAVVATWPVRTTTDTRMRGFESNALASAIFVVCRRRPEDAPTTTRGEFRRMLRKELPDALKKLQQGNIAPVDVAQASIGPGMAIFSRHKLVAEADGSAMSVRSALQLINEVLDEYLASGEGDFDADTRFAITWYEQHGWEVGAFGEAENVAKARNISVQGVVEAGICHSGAGKVRLLKRPELPAEYDLAADDRPTVWEFTQHMIRYLEEQGEEAAARHLKRLGPGADATRELAYRLYNTCERKKWADDARSYNGLILAWPELEKLAAMMTDEAPPAAPSKPGQKAKKSKAQTKAQQDLFEGAKK